MNELMIKCLRDALNNLYDPERLRANPLAKALGMADRGDAPISMQKIMERAIQSLKPKPAEANRSQKNRVYDLLYSRYVDQFSQKEVADQLGISLRTYQREQQTALEFLAALLIEKYPALATLSDEMPAAPSAMPQATAPEIATDDFSWMFSPAVEKSSDLAVVVATAQELIQPLVLRYAAQWRIDLPPGLPKVAVHSEALLQMMIHLLTVAIHQSAGGKMDLRARAESWQIVIRVAAPSLQALALADQANMAIVAKLVELADGAMHHEVDHSGFWATLRLPTLESLPILVIDDSTDNLKLLQRYLAGTRYQMSSLEQPERALDWIEQLQPQIVMLDLMMPKVDGLEILTRLKSNPATCQVAIIVCTILPQEELVLTLGASAFLQKPIMRENLLAVLDRLASAMETGTG